MVAPARPASAPDSANARAVVAAGLTPISLGGEGIVGVGAPFAPEAAIAKDDHQAETGGERDRADDKRHRRGHGDKIARARKRERLIELRAHPARPVALRQPQQLPQEEREAHGRHQRLLAAGMAQRNEHRTRRSEPPARCDGGRQHEGGDQQRGGGPADHGERRHRRRVAARRGDFAEGEIDPSDQAVDQRIGRRQQRVDRRRAADRPSAICKP